MDERPQPGPGPADAVRKKIVPNALRLRSVAMRDTWRVSVAGRDLGTLVALILFGALLLALVAGLAVAAVAGVIWTWPVSLLLLVCAALWWICSDREEWWAVATLDLAIAAAIGLSSLALELVVLNLVGDRVDIAGVHQVDDALFNLRQTLEATVKQPIKLSVIVALSLVAIAQLFPNLEIIANVSEVRRRVGQAYVAVLVATIFTVVPQGPAQQWVEHAQARVVHARFIDGYRAALRKEWNADAHYVAVQSVRTTLLHMSLPEKRSFVHRMRDIQRKVSRYLGGLFSCRFARYPQPPCPTAGLLQRSDELVAERIVADAIEQPDVARFFGGVSDQTLVQQSTKEEKLLEALPATEAETQQEKEAEGDREAAEKVSEKRAEESAKGLVALLASAFKPLLPNPGVALEPVVDAYVEALTAVFEDPVKTQYLRLESKIATKLDSLRHLKLSTATLRSLTVRPGIVRSLLLAPRLRASDTRDPVDVAVTEVAPHPLEDWSRARDALSGLIEERERTGIEDTKAR